MSSSTKDTGKETYQRILGLKDTKEDHPATEGAMRRRGKEPQGRITPQGHAPVRAISRPKLKAFSSPRPRPIDRFQKERDRLRQARLPKRKTLQEYDFNFPKRIPKQAILRLFDCDFVAQHGCAIFIGPTGTGKPRPA